LHRIEVILWRLRSASTYPSCKRRGSAEQAVEPKRLDEIVVRLDELEVPRGLRSV
jgi:hypothetical protein